MSSVNARGLPRSTINNRLAVVDVSDDVRQRFEAMLATWDNCQVCPLAATRRNVAHVRGALPCDVLFLGEFPYEEDDATGFPLVGRSGRLLQSCLDELIRETPFTYAATNTVGCVPWGDDDSHTYREPTRAELAHCLPRLIDLLMVARPKAVICLNDNVQKYWRFNVKRIRELIASQDEGYALPSDGMFCRIQSPAYILRTGGASTGNEAYRTVMSTLRQFIFTRVLSAR